MMTIVLGFHAQTPELLLQFFQFVIGEFLKIDKFISRAFDRANDLIEFQMKRFGIAVLRVLNNKYHQKGDDGGACVDNELPCIGKMKDGAGREPDRDNDKRDDKSPGAAKRDGRSVRETAECVPHAAKEVAFARFLWVLVLSVVCDSTLTSIVPGKLHV